MTASRALAFGELLRKHRIGAGVTQERLAELARVSANAISSLERGARRAPHRDTVALLALALGLTLQERTDFEQAAEVVRGRGASRATSSAPHLGNLPQQLTSFVGREFDIAQILELLSQHRHVTIVGSGGIGKTRLAQEAAKSTAARYSDGTWFVDLAPLTDEAFVVSTIGALLEIGLARSGSLEALVDGVRARRMLLILDNCEHVLAAAADAAGAILRASPNVSILATSRQRLGIAGERAYRLSSLSLPGKSVSTVAEGRAYSAIELFAQRAAAVEPRFRFDDEAAGPIAEVCRSLDGIPLAIELAAARLPALGLDELRMRLSRHFELLPAANRDLPARQQTLTAAFEWSYALLDDDERRLLRCLAIFAGGCTLEAAENICRGPNASRCVADALGSLVEKSLVNAEADTGATRYRLLEATRSFAMEKLTECGERDAVGAAHARWIASFADRMVKTYQIEPRQRWMASAAPELDNARSALEWTLSAADDAVTAGRIAGGLGGMWRIAGLEAERRRWVRAILDRLDPVAHPDIAARLMRVLAGSLNGHARVAAAARARTLCEAIGDRLGVAGCLTGEAIGLLQVGLADRALAHIDAAREIYRDSEVRTSPLFALMLVDRSSILQALGRYDEALADLGEARGLAELFEDETAAASVYSMQAEVAFEMGEAAEALRLALAGLYASQRSGLAYREMSSLAALAGISLALGDVEAARDFGREALAAAKGREPDDATIAVLHLAAVAAMQGAIARAGRLLGYIDRAYQRETYGVRAPTARASYVRLSEALRGRLSASELGKLLEQGSAMSEELAATEAMLI